MSEYNGWTNYETWNVKLWIDNDEHSSWYWSEQASNILDENDGDETTATFDLAKHLETMVMKNMPQMEAGPYQDILTAALQSVNWHEIAESMIGQAKEMIDDLA